jgi:ATP-dependent DNA helicase RecQ
VTVQPTRGGGNGGGRRRRRRGRGRSPGERHRALVNGAAPALLAPLDESADPIDRAARRIGIARLHPEQRAVIEAALDARDVLMVLPTGFGKSACYQVPSMLLERPVLLISPLLALLKDQHEKLIKHEIPCVRLDGTVRGKAREREIARLREGGSLLVMTTPESLGSEEIADALGESGVSLAAIDEAHCISEWGYDFRPAY